MILKIDGTKNSSCLIIRIFEGYRFNITLIKLEFQGVIWIETDLLTCNCHSITLNCRSSNEKCRDEID